MTTDVSAWIVLMLTSLVVSRTGDWLRDLLDPDSAGE
jgi:ABC-type dipeptide/oligopeptide/nickel transport system permease subunit